MRARSYVGKCVDCGQFLRNNINHQGDKYMFIKFNCFAEGNTESTEICLFQGIRFNKIGFAVLSTEHIRHDYLLPMDRSTYDNFLKMLEKSIAASTNILEVTGGNVYRVVKGSFLNVKEAKTASFGIKILDEK